NAERVAGCPVRSVRANRGALGLLRARRPLSRHRVALANVIGLNSDQRDVIAASRMSALQILVVGVTVGLNAMDGFDVLSISYASPGIASEWGIARAALGIVLSIEVVGMAIGSVGIGGVADTIGRRPTILGCLAVMATGMVMTTTVHGVLGLAVW